MPCLTNGQQVAALASHTMRWRPSAGTHLGLERLHLSEPVLCSQLLLSHFDQLLLLGHHLLLLPAHLQQRLDLGEEIETETAQLKVSVPANREAFLQPVEV